MLPLRAGGLEDALHAGRASASTSAAPRTAAASFRENIRGHLRFFLKHHGPAEAERVRTLLRLSLALRGRIVRGQRGAMYRDAAALDRLRRRRALIER